MTDDRIALYAAVRAALAPGWRIASRTTTAGEPGLLMRWEGPTRDSRCPTYYLICPRPLTRPIIERAVRKAEQMLCP